jgi:hypothetical protein
LFALDRSVFIHDALDSHNIDVLALSETWQTSLTTPSQLFDITPTGFQYLGLPRPSDTSSQQHVNRRVRSTITGGGLGFLVKDILCPETMALQSFTSFEIFAINVRSGSSSKLSIFNVYRPPSKPFSTFVSVWPRVIYDKL